MAKKKLKVKKRPIQLLVILIILIIGSVFGYNKYQEYLYHQSNEYKLLEHGYNEDELKLILKNLNQEEQTKLLAETKNTHLYPLFQEKYFLKNNLDRYLKLIGRNSKPDYTNIVALVNVGADKDWYDEEIMTDLDKGYAILVNKLYRLPDEYRPDDIVNISTQYAYDNNQARKVANDAFKDMANAALKEGHKLIVNSSFRSHTEQKQTYDYYDNYYGQEYADSFAARPGFSEHQTGLALDIVTPGVSTKDFKDHEAYKWLVNNSYKYGFILRFPENKEKITGYRFESWHYRYLGKDLAEKVYKEKITYDEYYAFYLKNKKN